MLESFDFIVFIKNRRRSILVYLASQKRRLATSILHSMLCFWLGSSLILIILILISFLIKRVTFNIFWIGFETWWTEFHLLSLFYFSIFSILNPNVCLIFRTFIAIDTLAVVGIMPLLVFILKNTIFIWLDFETIFAKTFFSSSWLCVCSPKTIVRAMGFILTRNITSPSLLFLQL